MQHYKNILFPFCCCQTQFTSLCFSCDYFNSFSRFYLLNSIIAFQPERACDRVEDRVSSDRWINSYLHVHLITTTITYQYSLYTGQVLRRGLDCLDNIHIQMCDNLLWLLFAHTHRLCDTGPHPVILSFSGQSNAVHMDFKFHHSIQRANINSICILSL